MRKLDFLPENCDELDCDTCPEEPLCRQIIADSLEFWLLQIPLLKRVKEAEKQK